MMRLAKLMAGTAGGLLIAASLPVAAQARCSTDDPLAFARTVYEKHQDFYYADAATLKNLLAPRLLAALVKDHACSNGEICAIEADPWMSAQDGDIGKPIDYKLTASGANTASVRMNYLFVLGDKKTPQSVELKLERDPATSCWLLGDLITPRDGSLREDIEKWHRQYGDGKR